MKLNLDFSDFNVNPELDDAECITEKLERFLEDQFADWDLDIAFDWNTLQYFNDHIEINFNIL
jgi:hypothetical protein